MTAHEEELLSKIPAAQRKAFIAALLTLCRDGRKCWRKGRFRLIRADRIHWIAGGMTTTCRSASERSQMKRNVREAVREQGEKQTPGAEAKPAVNDAAAVNICGLAWVE